MIKLSAFLTGTYLTLISSAFAVDDTRHGVAEGSDLAEMAHAVEGGAHGAEHTSKGGLPQFDP